YVNLAKFTQELDPVFAGHFQVSNNKVATLSAERSQRLVSARSRRAIEADLPSEDLENTAQSRVVIDDEETLHPETSKTGKLTRKTVPRPISLSTETRPRCSCTTRWTKVRPRPAPPSRRVKKGSKIRARTSSVIPGPSSRTSKPV